MKADVHKVTLLIVDTNQIGAEDIQTVLETIVLPETTWPENIAYPKRRIDLKVTAIETQEIDQP